MKVYDCFSFFNEIDLLEIRLLLLNDIVDKFVIVELNKTHRGEDKKYNFPEYKDRFQPYRDKIIYIQPEEVPVYKGAGDWTIENFQRNCIMRGLHNCEPEDMIIISDLDEIPNPYILKNLSQIHVELNYRLIVK